MDSPGEGRHPGFVLGTVISQSHLNKDLWIHVLRSPFLQVHVLYDTLLMLEMINPPVPALTPLYLCSRQRNTAPILTLTFQLMP